MCLVDDDAAVCRALALLLRTTGFSVEAFPSAEAFLGAPHAPPPDCLLLDVHLGGLSGFDLLERLVTMGVSIPAVFITGRDDVSTRERAQRMGAAGYLQKPFDAHALIGAIEDALAPA